VLRELPGREHRRFVWSEVSFFNRWYESLGKQEKETFKKLVHGGQIEFVNGGWVQNDEANPDPTAMVNQMATGHEYLLKNFGVSPRIAWQIDPFGHSAVTPSLWGLMGFEALVINRIHHALKDTFKGKQQMEFLWRGSEVGQHVDMFTHVLHTHYSAPPGFDWEEGALGVDPSTVQNRARDLSNILRQRMSSYKSGHLLVPFGDDFKFKAADRQFANMDRLIEHINQNTDQYRMKIRYSTLSEYFEAVSRANVRFPLLQGDFFPYADNEDSYWSGYYTTRPLLKQKSRKLNHIVRAAEQLVVLVRSSPHSNLDTTQSDLPLEYWENKFKEVERARMETALFLHHDAITGTSRSNVVQDYQQRMDNAAEQLLSIMARMMEHVLTKEPNPAPSLTQDKIIFAAPDSGQQSPLYHPIVYYNSLSWTRREVVSVRVSTRAVKIQDADGKDVPCQVDPFFKDLGTGEISPASNEFKVHFIVSIPPLGATTYFVVISSGGATESDTVSHSIATVYMHGGLRGRQPDTKSRYVKFEDLGGDRSAHFIENSFLKVYFSGDVGLLEAVEEKKRKPGEKIGIDMRFGRYQTSRSGAYLFRPQGRVEYWPADPNAVVRVVRGPIVSTILTRFRSYDVITQIFGGINEESAEIANHIAMKSWVSIEANQELVATFLHGTRPGQGAEWKTEENEFWTNSGLSFIRRRTRQGVVASANFFPMVLGARMRSESLGRTVTFISGHSMAVGQVEPGIMEFMMHRSLAQDDGRGLAEAVNDNSRVEIPLWIEFDHEDAQMGPGRGTDVEFKRKSIRLNNPLRAFYKLPHSGGGGGNTDSFMSDDHVESPAVWRRRQHDTFSPLRAELPRHVHLFSLQVRDSVTDDVVLRFQNLSPTKGTSWIGHLGELFEDTFAVSEVRRSTLSLNTLLPLNGKYQKSLKFLPTPDAPASPYPDLSAAGSSTDSQNTNEEGVFLSQAALEKMRQDQLRSQGAAAAAQRRLLEQMEREGLADSELANSDDFPSSLSASRHLLSSPNPFAAPLFVLKPLQLHTYIVRLGGSEWAEAAEGVMVGIGERNDRKRIPWLPKERQDAPLPPPVLQERSIDKAQAQQYSEEVRQQKIENNPPLLRDELVKQGLPGRPAGGGDMPNLGGIAPNLTPTPVGSFASDEERANVLHGHEHTIIPGRTREAWRLIPSRWEYMLVLVVSLIGVGFFMADSPRSTPLVLTQFLT
jgi:hypothetical protein